MNRQTGIYLRISSDPTGKRLGVTRQRRDCEKKAVERGWTIAAVFEDNDVSASTGKRRPQYEAMLDAVRSGAINAVVVWDLDRLTRRPIEIEHFIDLADKHHIELASVGGDVDLATDNGRMFARIKGAVARAEIERKAARQKAANEQRRDAGKPHIGRRPFGYSKDGMEIDPTEAAAIQKAAASLLAGSSMYQIAADLNASGHSTTAGNPWKPTEARRMLARPRYAGLLEHKGEIVGQGSWPAILDLDTHRGIRGILSDPERHKAGPPRRYLLSGLALCAVCGEPLFGGFEKRKRYSVYRCPSRGHVSRQIDPVDEFVQAVVVERLGRPDAVELFVTKEDVDQATTLRAEDRQIRARLDALAEAFAAGEIEGSQLKAGTRRLRTELQKVTGELTGLSTMPLLADVVRADDIDRKWHRLSLDRQRTIIRALLTIVVASPGQGARRFDPETITLDWIHDE